MSTTALNTSLKENFTTSFDLFEQSLNGAKNSYLHTIRKRAFESFLSSGFPTIKNEEWKYFNPAPVFNETLFPAVHAEKTSAHLNHELFGIAKINRIVLVNGNYDPTYSKIIDKNLIVKNISAALRENTRTIKEHFNQHVLVENAFTNLNTAFAGDGLLIQILKGEIVEHPVFIFNFISNENNQTLHQSRTLIVAEENSQAQFVEIFQNSTQEFRSIENSLTEFYAATGSHINFIRSQVDESDYNLISSFNVVQEAKSVFDCTTVSTAGRLLRNNITVKHLGQHCETHLNGLYLVDGKDLIDNHLLIDHAQPNCESHQLYKGILNDEGRGVFNGKIFVKPQAQKTNAFQSNKNILLSEKAVLNAKPQLEIFADDVKCSHGATSGFLDENALFYLISRGISKENAKAMLIHAFAAEIIAKVKVESMHDYFNKILVSKLKINF